jgi:hypothetical protein
MMKCRLMKEAVTEVEIGAGSKEEIYEWRLYPL